MMIFAFLLGKSQL